MPWRFLRVEAHVRLHLLCVFHGVNICPLLGPPREGGRLCARAAGNMGVRISLVPQSGNTGWSGNSVFFPGRDSGPVCAAPDPSGRLTPVAGLSPPSSWTGRTNSTAALALRPLVGLGIWSVLLRSSGVLRSCGRTK